MADGDVSPVDSLDGDDRQAHSGVIKVASKSLLAELTTNSLLPHNFSTAQIRTNDYSHQTDLSDYQYVNSDYDEAEEAEESTSFPKEQSAQPISPQPLRRVPKKDTSVDKFVPPLVLTDSLIADDPETDGSKAVADSLDLSMTDEDFARLENLMSTNKPLPNPFNALPSEVNGQMHTPRTTDDLRLSLTLVQSATPRPIQSQSDREQSVLSRQEEQTTPRVSQPNLYQSQAASVSQPAASAFQNPQVLASQPGYYSDGQGQMKTAGIQQHTHFQGPQSTPHYPTQQNMQYQQSHLAHQQHQPGYPAYTDVAQQYHGGFVPSQYQQQQDMSSQYVNGRQIQQQYEINNYALSPGKHQQPVAPQYQTGGFMPQHNNGLAVGHVQHHGSQYIAPQHHGQHPPQGQPRVAENNIQGNASLQGQYQLNSMSQYQAQSYQPKQHQNSPYLQNGTQLENPQQSGHQFQSSQASNSAKMPPNASPRSVRSSAQSENKSKVIGTVAPKPGRPDKDFIERNINRARGVSSAKGGYASRLVQSRQQEEERKQWAPGMVVPRKKAASADNALRAPKPPDLEPEMSSTNEVVPEPPQNVWEKRAMQLSQVKSRPAKKRNGGASTSQGKQESNKSSISIQGSPKEARVKVDVNLETSVQGLGSSTHMRPIGPIPQHPERKIIEAAYPSQAGPTYGSPPNSIPQYESPRGSHRYHTQLTSTSVGHQVPSGHQEGFDTVDTESAYSGSYSQYYQSSLQSTADLSATQRVQTESRWNPQNKPPNFVSDGNDFTLEDIIALEQEKSQQLSVEQSDRDSSSPRVDSTHSGRELNPYQTVPPIHQHFSEESRDSGSQSYSQIHKSLREKEDKGASYKKYTLKDYKKLNKDVKLGGLGPSADPNVLKEKHELRQKQLQLAKQARETEAKKAKAKAKEGKKEEKPVQPSGRQLANEYSKTVPKPKVVSKLESTPEPVTTLKSARSLSKLNDIDQPQLTYRTNNSTLLAHQTNLKALKAHGSTNGVVPLQLANGIEGRSQPFPHSRSSPVLNQSPSSYEQTNYTDTIELLHKRHLEEKRLIAGIRQKI